MTGDWIVRICDLLPDSLVIITIIRINPITTAKKHSARRLIIISWIISCFLSVSISKLFFQTLTAANSESSPS